MEEPRFSANPRSDKPVRPLYRCFCLDKSSHVQPFAGERTFSSADSALAELPRWQSIINWILLYFPNRVLQAFPPVTLLTLKTFFCFILKARAAPGNNAPDT